MIEETFDQHNYKVNYNGYELRREVFPTLNKEKYYAESPKIITFDNFFLLIFFIDHLPEYKNKYISIIIDFINIS